MDYEEQVIDFLTLYPLSILGRGCEKPNKSDGNCHNQCELQLYHPGMERQFGCICRVEYWHGILSPAP